MALIKCSACGRRMLGSHGLRFCTNCGAPLQRGEAAHAQDWMSSALPAPEAEEPPESPLPSGTSRALVPRPGGTVTRASRGRDYRAIEPYGKRQPMELEPYSAPGVPQPYAEPPEWPGWDGRQQNKDEFTTIVTEVPGVAAPWQDTRDGLPWWFPRRAPDIAGKLIYVQEQRVYHRIWDIGEGLARLLGDAVWSLAGGGGGAGGHQQHPWGGHGDTVVTILRVRIDDGTQRDARIRGHLTGANLTLGDRIELWGWKRRGVLMVRKGYNRTSRSVVSSSAMRSPLPVLVLLLLLAAGFCLWLYSNHIPLWPR